MLPAREVARSGQAKDGYGITEFVLKGEDFSTCGRAQSAATKKRKPPPLALGERPRRQVPHRGLNSVATVRGTTWRVTDTCAGTTTTVYSGSVVVREARSGRSYVVRKGQQHLAAARRRRRALSSRHVPSPAPA